MKRQNDIEEKNIYFGCVLLILLYLVATVFTIYASRSQDILYIGVHQLPLSAFTGVFSSVANICSIFLVVFYGKVGLIFSLVFIVIQCPMLIMNMYMRRSLASLPGLFTGLFTILTLIIIYRSNKKMMHYRQREFESLMEKQQISQKLFEQTATALVNAIDAKDTYSHGHSLRVAEYSEKIARQMGKSDEECYKVYYAALLHDVGKIGIDESIINKKGRLTEEEYEIIKQHPVMGNQILSSINEYPYLSIGAHYHHERYDGKGYPDRLKGEDIPEIARIISVADAYDAMSSNRSYRDAIPQQLVREEIIKGAGTQFDPEIAGIMQHLIDIDTNYHMKEKSSVKELAGRNELRCGKYKSEVSDGIMIDQNITKIHMKFTPETDTSKPALILFDSLDERFHDDERTRKDLNYFEYCVILFDGTAIVDGARKTQTQIIENEQTDRKIRSADSTDYDIEVVKVRDHILVCIDDGEKTVRVTVALPDSSRFAYLGMTGENCFISNVSVSRSEEPVPDYHIERIAEEISYIKGEPEGDIPNIQIDGFRYDATQGVPIKDGMKLTFHTKSLPTARLVWHCAFIDVFYSQDRKVTGPDYKEYGLVRLDGENWKDEGSEDNTLIVNKTHDFVGWEEWKRINKRGFDVTVYFERHGDTVTVRTENLGVSLKNVITIPDGRKDIYVAITGDQCAVTNIRIS